MILLLPLHGTFVPFPRIYYRDQILTLDDPVRAVLAAGAGGAAAVSGDLGGAAALPDCRDRGRRGAGAGLGGRHTAGAGAAPDLTGGSLE